MNYNINKDTLVLNKTVFEECKEQAIDADFNLPDYCSDIQKILKCRIHPKVNAKNIHADRLDIDGTAVINILYIDGSKIAIRKCEHTVPFTCSFNINNISQDSAISSKIKVEYVNCRAVSPRRLDIHGAFSVKVKINSKILQEVVFNIDGKNIEQKKVLVKASNTSGIGSSQFNINEIIELGSNRPSVESIIRANSNVILNDSKTIADKIILKGEIILKILYLSDIATGGLEIFEYSLPVNQVIDIPGIKDDSECDVNLEILDLIIKPKADGSGENTLLETEVKIYSSVISYEDKEIHTILDAYSLDYEAELEYKQVTFPKIWDKIDESFINKFTLETGEKNISRIIDIWDESLDYNYKKTETGLNFFGKLEVCILALDKNENLFYYEKNIDFEYIKEIPEKPEDIYCESDIKIISLNYRLSGENRLEIKAEFKINSSFYNLQKYKILNNIFINEEKLKEKEGLTALTIYYADKGEDIWDISRRYCTSAELVKIQNSLQEDILKNRSMLLIPMNA